MRMTRAVATTLVTVDGARVSLLRDLKPLKRELALSAGGLLGVLRTGLKVGFQAACLVRWYSSSTSSGVLHPRAEWDRF